MPSAPELASSPIEASHDDVAMPLFPTIPDDAKLITKARRTRNVAWKGNPHIPGWVDIEQADLDRFFTRPEIAKRCHGQLMSAMADDKADVSKYKFVDPSAGDGVFFDLLPKDRRIGIEIVPGRKEFEAEDFLSWTPALNKQRYAIVGNPPFGYRSWLALAFVNHAATFADYIGFILPMAFQSVGKGSPQLRVKGAELIQSLPLPAGSFISDTGQPVSVNALWQIWRRGHNVQKPQITCNGWVDLFTVDMRKERLCGQNRLGEADWFLQRTFYGEPPVLVRDFSQVQYVCGYGIIIRKKKKAVADCLRNVDWRQYSNLAAHNCRHISMYHIRQALIENGFTDEQESS